MINPLQAMENNGETAGSLHDFVVQDIYGDSFELSDLSGKKVMVVNTASECGLTPQYEELEQLYQKYGGDGFVIIGFPANNFMNQEPGSDEEIITFCQENYGVSFPMMSKISVKGDDIAPVYEWLTREELNGKMDAEIAWNFQKFLIDADGQIVDVLSPRDSPLSSEVTDWITEK
ncbi:MAG: glutathione peroxidase [Bacteroidales bacterium]